MTLLVGALFPWTSLREHKFFNLPLPGSRPAQAPIIAADSRWTYKNGRIEDGAVKVFGIAENAIAGYAGTAGLGESAIESLSRDLEPAETIKDFSAQVSSLLDAVQRASHNPDDELHLILGFSQADGSGWLGYFASPTKFEVEEVTNVKLVGPPEASIFVEQSLRAAVLEQLNPQRAISLLPDSWAALVAASVRQVCDLQIHPAVGGKIQCCLSRLGETRGVGVHVLERLAADNPMVNAISLEPPETKFVTRSNWRISPKPSTNN